jgi:hypothetical protein
MCLWLDGFSFVLCAVILGVVVFEVRVVCAADVAVREEWAGLLLPGG